MRILINKLKKFIVLSLVAIEVVFSMVNVYAFENTVIEGNTEENIVNEETEIEENEIVEEEIEENKVEEVENKDVNLITKEERTISYRDEEYSIEISGILPSDAVISMGDIVFDNSSVERINAKKKIKEIISSYNLGIKSANAFYEPESELKITIIDNKIPSKPKADALVSLRCLLYTDEDDTTEIENADITEGKLVFNTNKLGHIILIETYTTTIELKQRTITKTLSDGSKITISGILPEDAEIEAFLVKESDLLSEKDAKGRELVKVLKTYDIKIKSEDGYYQPTDYDNSVDVRIENKDIIPPKSEDENLVLYHTDEEGNTDSIDTAQIQRGIASFTTDSFSEFTLATTKSIGNYIVFSSDSSFTIKTGNQRKNWKGSIEYSIDNGKTWTTWDGKKTIGNSLCIYMRGQNNTYITGTSSNYGWTLTGSNIYCSGNIENLLDYTKVQQGIHPSMATYCFAYMFYNCRNLVQAPDLSAITLSDSCYREMFHNCYSLKFAPDLPALVLTEYCYYYMFEGCDSLEQAPVLSATTVNKRCCYGMFYGCINLKNAPELTATTLADYCYDAMFSGCTSLDQAPDLPATTLAASCYSEMFSGCTSLEQAPDLPATELANFCYDSMFIECTNLKFAPTLPVTTLAKGCYEEMFESCVNLEQAPDLPATTLADYCYDGMFSGCTSLEQAPELPATTLTKYCYQHMFESCINLEEVPELPSTSLADGCYLSMFAHCTKLKQLPELKALTLPCNCYNYMFFGCTSIKLSKIQTDVYNKTFRIPTENRIIEAYDEKVTYGMFGGTGGLFVGTPEINTVYYVATDGVEEEVIIDNPLDYALKFSSDSDFCLSCYIEWNGEFEYSIDDGNTWHIWDGSELEGTATQAIYIRGSGNLQVSTGHYGDSAWYFNGKYCTGNIETLLDYKTVAKGMHPVMDSECYICFFAYCGNLVQVPTLPATILTDDCYNGMFSYCSNLKIPPALPATVLADACYADMFYGCENLITLPELPATTLVENCYRYMFDGCDNIKLSETPNEESVYAYRIPSCGSIIVDETFYAENFMDEMFTSTGGTFTGIPEVNKTYYLSQPTVTSGVTPAVKFSSSQDFTLQTSNESKIWNGSMEYSLDYGNTWVAWTGTSISVPNTTVLYMRGKDNNRVTEKNEDTDNYEHWILDGTNIYCEGNIENLLDYRDVLNGEHPDMAHSCFKEMFIGNDALISAPALPFETLSEGCYSSMFKDCSRLKNAPALPALELTSYCYLKMFDGCKALECAPELPARKLKYSCYFSMFDDCDSLIVTPILNATELAERCYWGMFKSCSSLQSASDLPALDLAPNCYESMFKDCTALKEAPNLPALNLAEACYSDMFVRCSSLVKASDLPATVLVENCYSEMYKGCSSLQEAPVLCATTLVDGCYKQMFKDCTSLIATPNLYALNLATSCYSGMFQGCTSLKEISSLPATKLSGYCYNDMFRDCTALETLPDLPALELRTHCYDSMFRNCSSLKVSENKTSDYNKEYRIPKEGEGELSTDSLRLMFEGTSGTFKGTPNINTKYYLNTMDVNAQSVRFSGELGRSFTLKTYDEEKHWNGVLEYSVDGGSTWNEWNGTQLTVAADTNIYLRGIGNTVLTGSSWDATRKDYDGRWVFEVEDDFYVHCDGNIENLLDYTVVQQNEHPQMDSKAFMGLFKNANIDRPPLLPALVLTDSCYESMFEHTKLHSAPILPASTLAKGCYSYMFQDCYSLINMPELPALIMKDACYKDMFCGCSSLRIILDLPATILAEHCYDGMFSWSGVQYANITLDATELQPYCYKEMFGGCVNLRQPPILTATTLAEGCYCAMFEGCSELEYPSELPVTTLAPHCYEEMFCDCVSLIQAPELPATTLTESCYQYMFSGCKSLQQSPELPATVLAESGYEGMFFECISLKQVPELTATELADSCYASMFAVCIGLEQPPILPATILADNCYTKMFMNCINLERLTELPSKDLPYNCYSEMFRGCSKVKISEVKTDEYSYVYRVPKKGEVINEYESLTDMFVETGGIFTGTPEINKVYYLASEPVRVLDYAYYISMPASLLLTPSDVNDIYECEFTVKAKSLEEGLEGQYIKVVPASTTELTNEEDDSKVTLNITQEKNYFGESNSSNIIEKVGNDAWSEIKGSVKATILNQGTYKGNFEFVYGLVDSIE